ncbi:LysR family transcriptional regulator [Streptomyces boncukensis]|uniref:LysR family transcriptional regulator n=1 Tax=Streptomyces boncukensis TaxID=2711219 RepID=A0A6G4X693_9ACTN|nr:LysR family transcriptional regulator [Streptomyces boncukensis]NGO72380.1 LysR family transcriptional regulator [Streptomyces boncukensis]
MDLRLLSSFLAVVEEGHFGRAAARLFLSPAAVTQHIAKLESALGAPLLHRGPPVSPTPAGLRMAGHARTLLAAADAARDDMAEFTGTGGAPGRPDEGRPLRVGIMGHGSAELTPAAINAFRRARPGVPVEVGQLDFTEHSSALLEDRVDVAFIRPAPDDERVAVDVLTTEQRIVAVPESSPYAAAREEGLRVADVAAIPFFRVPPHTPRPFTEYLYFGDEGARRGDAFALTPQEVLTGVVTGRAAGSGLKSFARYYGWPGAVFVPVLDAPWESTYLAVRADDAGRPHPEIPVFRALTLALARELGPQISRGAAPR